MRERCISLDRAQRRQLSNIIQSDYIPEKSSNRAYFDSYHDFQHVPSVPNIYYRKYGGGGGERNINSVPQDQDIADVNEKNLMQMLYKLQNMPEDFLDDLDEPPLDELASSFDEVRCILASPTAAARSPMPTAAQALDDFRKEVAEAVALDNLQAEMCENQQIVSEQVSNVRQPIGPALSKYQIPPLPADPYEIPPPPKSAKDIPAMIRRARAIERLKLLLVEEAPTQPSKDSGRNLRGTTRLKVPVKQVQTLPKPRVGTGTISKIPGAKSKNTGPTPKNTGAIPKNTGAIPKNTGAIPKKTGAIPKPSGAIPKPSGAIPKPSGAIPKPSGAIPKPSGAIPKPSGAIPKPSGAIPKPSGAIPKPSGAIPKPSGAIPKPSGAIPKPSGIIPKPSGAIPKPSCVILKLSGAIPKPSGAIPKPSGAIPKPSGAIPKPSGAIPKPSGAIPKPSGAIPKPSGAIPKPSGAIPKPSGAIPKPSGAIPKPSGAIPRNTGAIPKNTGAIPKPSGAIPRNTGAIPKQTGAIPKNTGAIPKQTGAIPKNTGAIPKKTGAIPKNTGAIPKKTGAIPKSTAAISKSTGALPKKTGAISKSTGAIPKKQPKKLHPPDYVPDDWAAAILKCRKQAGLKTTNPKLLPKPKTPPAPAPAPPPPSPKAREPPTYETILERVAAIKSSKSRLKAPSKKCKRRALRTNMREDIDDFEIMEELFGAEQRGQSPRFVESEEVIQNRIIALQQQLLPSPAADLNTEDLNEVIAYEEELAAAGEQGAVYELPAILRYQDYLVSREDVAAAVATIGLMQKAQAKSRSPSPTCVLTPEERAAVIEIMENDQRISETITAPQQIIITDDSSEMEDDASLDEVSMPDAGADISIDEQGVEDVSSPELCEVSISDDSLALEPDYPLETVQEEDEVVVCTQVEQENPKQGGFLSSIVCAVGNTFKSIFSAKPPEEVVEAEPDQNASLPNLFKITPKKVRGKKVKEKPSKNKGKAVENKPPTATVVPPHPKNPKDYSAMVKRARAIQKKRAQESSVSEVSVAPSKEIKKKKEIKSTIPKRRPPLKKKPPTKDQKKQKKIYPPGEYSPSVRKAVATARKLAGLKNVSALLNPEREARIAAAKAAKQAKLEALAALPPVERMREKMKGKKAFRKPGIETLATLEAIRASQAEPTPPKECEDILIRFSPLKQKEAELRLRYLKEQANKQAAEALQAEAEIQEEISESQQICSPTPSQILPLDIIELDSLDRSRTEETRSEKITTQRGQHGGTEIIREEITKSSTVENGEVHTHSRQVTTKTDEYGNVTTHVEEDQGLSGQKDPIQEDLDDVEAPDFVEMPDERTPSDLSIPNAAEIINTIRTQVQQKIDEAFENVQALTPQPAPPVRILFPEHLPEEELSDIEEPELERSPPKVPPEVQILSQIENDQRMYAWGEHPPAPSQQPVIPQKDYLKVPQAIKRVKPLPKPKPKPSEEKICVPAHPKNPKDYKTMIERARAIQTLRKRQQDLEAKSAPPAQPPAKVGRVPISRWIAPPQRASKITRKRLVLKKRVPKISPKQQKGDNEGRRCPTEPPPLAQQYREAVARARLIRGLKNRTAALNPAIAARKAKAEAAKAAFEALPENEKIKLKLKRLLKIPAEKRRIQPTAEILGTLAGIRAAMPPLEEVLRQPSPAQQVQSSGGPCLPVRTPQAPARPRGIRTKPITPVLDVDETESSEAMPDTSETRPESSQEYANLSLDYLEVLEQSNAEFDTLIEDLRLYDYNTPIASTHHERRRLIDLISPSSRPMETRLQTPPQSTDNTNLLRPSPSTPSAVSRATAEADLIANLIADFRIQVENVLETSQLLPETPPANIQERFERIKEAQDKHTTPSGYSEQPDEISDAASYQFSPVMLMSPSGSVCAPVEEDEQQTSVTEEADLLIDLDKTPVPAPKQFRDLEDIPLDDLDYEDDPGLTNISLDRPVTPPPSPSDILKRICSKVRQEAREQSAPQISPQVLEVPEDLPDEELLEVSIPSLSQSPKPPSPKQRSPAVPPPMVCVETQPDTSLYYTAPQIQEATCPSANRPADDIPVRKDPSPKVKPARPKYRKEFIEMILRAREIHKLKKQKEAEELAKAPAPQPSKQTRVPISRWVKPPPQKAGAKPRKRLVLKKRVQKPADNQDDDQLRPLTEKYREAVARARALHGLQNKTAALNPKLAAQIAARKAAREAAIAKYNALPEVEKMKVRLQRFRRKPHRRPPIKPTLEQIAYLQALKQVAEYQSRHPSEFEVSEGNNLDEDPISPTTLQQFAIQQRIGQLEQKLRDLSDIRDTSLAEFETAEAAEAEKAAEAAEVVEAAAALEAARASPCPRPAEPVMPFHFDRNILQKAKQQLETLLDPKERYQQLMARRKLFTSPPVSPVKSPEVRYSPIILSPSPSRAEPREDLPEEETVEELEEMDEPSFMDTSATTVIERPRPRDVIEAISKHLKETRRPEVPTGRLIELRTPPPMLPLPEEVPEHELLHVSCPAFARTPSPVRSRSPSPTVSHNVSLPEIFVAPPSPPPITVAPPPPRDPSPKAPPARRDPSPEGPIVIPPHPKNPKDFESIIARARKIHQLLLQKEKEKRAVEEAATARGAIPKKKGREPISRWAAPPPRKPGKRKILVMRKRTGTAKRPAECPAEPPPLPEFFAKQVALSRSLAGLRSRTAALNPKVAAKEAAKEAAKAEAIKRAEEAKAKRIAALNAPPPSPIKDYATVLSKLKEIQEKGAPVSAQPSLASVAYLDALKGAMQINQQQQQSVEPPQARYKRIISRHVEAPSIEVSSIEVQAEDIRYSPIRFSSPVGSDTETELAKYINEYEFADSFYEQLKQLEELGGIEQPSFDELSESQLDALTPPVTPPPTPSRIISRIRQQYVQEKAISPESRIPSPVPLELPKELPEERLLEHTPPAFDQSPPKQPTPIRSPNVTIPCYFMESPRSSEAAGPAPKSVSPCPQPLEVQPAPKPVSSPQLLGIHPGVRARTPQGPIKIPSHPKDPKDVAAMIRRAQLIHKLLEKEAALKAATAKAAKVRVPISRRIPVRPVPEKRKPMTRLVTKGKGAVSRPTKQCAKDQQKLSERYLAEIARARKMAGLRNQSALLNPAAAAKQLQKAKPEAPKTVPAKVPTQAIHATPNYNTIMERVAAIRAKRQTTQPRPNARELTRRQHLINLQQREERQRILQELEILRGLQGNQMELLKTPPPPNERLEAIKSKIQTERRPPSEYPYSPVKTPEAIDVPQYQPITLPKTPPFQFVDEDSIVDIQDISIAIEELGDYTLELVTEDEEDLDFQLAEAATGAITELDDIDMGELQRLEFDLAKQIQMLERQLIGSSNANIADILEQYNIDTTTQQQTPAEACASISDA